MTRHLPIVALASVALSSIVVAAQSPAKPCPPPGPLVQVPGLSEASGLAISRRAPDRLWTHNDSGEPVVVALDASGAVTGRVRVSGAAVEDWEAIAAGPCGSGSCLYIGDIGDNEAQRAKITVYRVPEPDGQNGTASVTAVYHATYPDGAHDAEALLVAGDGRLYVVTKGETGPLGVYRFPAQPQPGATVRLERVATAAKPTREAQVTDGAMSPDGEWTVLRTRTALTYYRTSDLLAGRWRAESTIDLSSLKEPQGEGVAIGSDRGAFVVGEGGGKDRPGTFARLACAPGR